MKKKINRQFTEEEKAYIKKNRKILLIRSVLMLGFLLVFNVFAWFIYISKVNTEMDVRALSWDVVFSEGGSAVKDVTIALDVYPGMEQYTHNISVTNSGETAANLYFDTQSVTLFGTELLTSGMTEAQKQTLLQTLLPLTIGYTLELMLLINQLNLHSQLLLIGHMMEIHIIVCHLYLFMMRM